MGWNFDDYDHYKPYDDPHREPGPNRLVAILVGLGMGLVTLLVIASIIFATVGYLFVPETTTTTQRAERSRVSTYDNPVNANYRASDWTEPSLQQFTTPTPVPPEFVASADAEYTLLTNIYERVNPSVVNIEIVSAFHSDSSIIDSSGSGFVLDMDGHIATNAHVVREADEILVTFFNGYVTNAELVGLDDYSDLAVIRVDASKAPLLPLALGDSNLLRVGQRVIAIGNPFGLDGSMTVGIVSALGRSLPSARLLDPNYDRYDNPSIIQIDASVNPGNSGGPLLNSYGEVIGINTAIRTENGSFQGVAFAVPVNTVKRIMPQLIDDGEVQYSWLGISTPSSEPGLSVAALADELNLPVRNGVMISEVFVDSPADRAGLRGGTDLTDVRGFPVPLNGDIIVAINGQMVRDIDDLVAYLVENTSPGDTVVLTIVRDRETLDLDVELGVRP